MNNELKQAIIKAIFENKDNFQLLDCIKDIFRAYIYDKDGEYLIGGEVVAYFINRAVDLITK